MSSTSTITAPVKFNVAGHTLTSGFSGAYDRLLGKMSMAKAEDMYFECKKHFRSAKEIIMVYNAEHSMGSAEATTLVVREYIRFMAMKMLGEDISTDALLSPPAQVDAFWHVHLTVRERPQSHPGIRTMQQTDSSVHVSF
jgi:hypothetical protein